MKNETSADIPSILNRYYKEIDDATQMDGGNFMVDSQRMERISNIFSENAVYERKGWEQAFKGRKAIENFFNEERTLLGSHSVKEKDITVKNGIDPSIEVLFHSHFSDPDDVLYHTAKVKGTFGGAKCHVPGDDGTRFVNGTSGVRMGFVDYWVFRGEQAIYRYSDITPSPSIERERF